MRILLWLSGWVDSAVAAHLLLQQWHDVIAGFMKNYADEDNPHCQTRQDREVAREVAEFLGITQFMTFDFVTEYHERIIQYIYDGYAAGVTPNPDVLCNNLVKFDLFREQALELGCDAVATGHYARVIRETKHASPLIKGDWGGFENHEEKFKLLKGVDHSKDQSYFLSGLDQTQLSQAMFPLWDLTKDQVRDIAHQIWLPNADRKDSQWLCFIGKVPIKQFLSEALPTKTGNILDIEWNVLWQHDGAHFLTIWQRTGLWLSWWPRYVISKNTDTNTVVVSKDEHTDLMHSSLIATNIHWTSGTAPALPRSGHAKIRYRQADQECIVDTVDDYVSKQTELSPPVKGVELSEASEGGLNNLLITFKKPQRAISPGQVVVLYDGDEVVGNGVIL